MGQQGGQTEALWTHLDPSKPQERLHAPAGAHARSAATCHNHTEQEASDHGRTLAEKRFVALVLLYVVLAENRPQLGIRVLPVSYSF